MISARSQRTQRLKDVSRRLKPLQEMMLKAKQSLDASLTYHGEGAQGHSILEDSDAELIEPEEKALNEPRLQGGRGRRGVVEGGAQGSAFLHQYRRRK